MVSKGDNSRSQAVVALEPRRDPPAVTAARPHATFVTQIIACERRLDAYRARRRAEPEEASARYGAAAALAAPSIRLRGVL